MDELEQALEDNGYGGMEEFLRKHTGKTFTEMAAALQLPTQTFIKAHNRWVDRNAPPLWES